MSIWKRWIAIENDLLADEQMQIDKKQDSTYTSSMLYTIKYNESHKQTQKKGLYILF